MSSFFAHWHAKNRDLFLYNSSGTKDTIVETGAGDSTAPKKLKKKRRLKEEVKQWEESRRCCSDDQRSDTEAAEALPKKGTVESTGRPTHHTLLHWLKPTIQSYPFFAQPIWQNFCKLIPKYGFRTWTPVGNISWLGSIFVLQYVNYVYIITFPRAHSFLFYVCSFCCICKC